MRIYHIDAVRTQGSQGEEATQRVGVASDDAHAISRLVRASDGKGNDGALVPGDKVPPASLELVPPVVAFFQADETGAFEPGDGMGDGVEGSRGGSEEREEAIDDGAPARRSWRDL